MRQNFRIGGCLEDCSVIFQCLPEPHSVHQVAIMGEAEVTAMALEQERLYVGQLAAARRRIPHMPDGMRELAQGDQLILGQRLGQKPHAAGAEQILAVCTYDACTLLSPVLQAVEADIRQFACALMIPYSEYSTFFIQSTDVIHFGIAPSHASATSARFLLISTLRVLILNPSAVNLPISTASLISFPSSATTMYLDAFSANRSSPSISMETSTPSPWNEASCASLTAMPPRPTGEIFLMSPSVRRRRRSMPRLYSSSR